MRIVSLLPSATEIVCALGFRSSLVGRSHECDYPPGVRDLPVLTSPKADVTGDSLQIHENVQRAAGDDGVYELDLDLLRELQPTHIVTQAQCDVCAVSFRDVEGAVTRWTGASAPRITALNPTSVEGVYDDIRRTAVDLGDAPAGDAVAANMKSRIAAISSRVPGAEKPTVAAIEWIAPLMAAGNWVPELIEAAGGISLFGEPGSHSPWISWSELTERDPDIVVLMPCGFDIETTMRDVPLLTSAPAWRDLRAVRSGSVFVVDGNQYFNRPGPRLADSVEILAAIFYPEVFPEPRPFFSRIGRSIATSTIFSMRSP